MISINRLCRPFNRQRRIGIAVVLVGVLLVAALLQSTVGKPETVACLIYAVLASAFLVAQLIGFVLTQTDYSEELEAAKFHLLEIEEAEWKHLDL